MAVASDEPSGPRRIGVGTAPPGDYITTVFEPPLLFTIASDGWLFFFQDDDDELALGKAGGIELTGSRVNQVVDPTTHQPVAAPDDLIAWFEAHPELDVAPGPSGTVAGLEAASVDVAVPGDADVEILAFPTGNLRVSTGSRARIWVAPLGDEYLVFCGFGPEGSFEAALPELEALVESFRMAGS